MKRIKLFIKQTQKLKSPNKRNLHQIPLNGNPNQQFSKRYMDQSRYKDKESIFIYWVQIKTQGKEHPKPQKIEIPTTNPNKTLLNSTKEGILGLGGNDRSIGFKEQQKASEFNGLHLPDGAAFQLLPEGQKRPTFFLPSTILRSQT